MPTLTFFLLGASGRIGLSVLNQLHQLISSAAFSSSTSRESIKIKAAHCGTKGNEIEKIQSACPSAESIQLNLLTDSIASLAEKMKNTDTLFLLTPYTIDMLIHTRNAVDAAVEAGIKTIVKLGVNQPQQTLVNFAVWHLMCERYIISSGLNWIFIRPCWFISNLLDYGGIKPMQQGEIHWPISSDVRLGWATNQDIGQVVANVMMKTEQYHKQIISITSFFSTMKQIQESSSTILGKQVKLIVEDVDEMKKKLIESGSDEMYMNGFAMCVKESNAVKDHEVVDEIKRGIERVQEIGGKQPMELKEWIEMYKNQLMD